MFEQFLKGIGGTFFLMGIFIMSFPVLTSRRSFKQMMWGTSHLEFIGTAWGFMVSTWIFNEPLISIESYSSGIRALILMVISSPILTGYSMVVVKSAIYGVLIVKTVAGALTFSRHSAQTFKMW